MDIDSVGTSNWLYDYGIVDDIAVAACDFPAPVAGFSWPSQPINSASHISEEADYSLGDGPDGTDSLKGSRSRKRSRPEQACASGSKACWEKLRRDRLNERFLELGSILEPGKLPKTDKATILSHAVRMVTQLQSDILKLKESNENLQAKIKELKAEKIELRDEKQRLKADKEKLEQQVKALSSQPNFPAPPPAMSAAFATQGQMVGNKLMPFIGYPSVAMWQFMPPAAVDTSQDHVVRSPVA